MNCFRTNNSMMMEMRMDMAMCMLCLPETSQSFPSKSV